MKNQDVNVFWLAVGMISVAVIYFFISSFCNLPAANQHRIDVLIAFFEGSLVNSVMGKYFSPDSKKKDDAPTGTTTTQANTTTVTENPAPTQPDNTNL